MYQIQLKHPIVRFHVALWTIYTLVESRYCSHKLYSSLNIIRAITSTAGRHNECPVPDTLLGNSCRNAADWFRSCEQTFSSQVCTFIDTSVLSISSYPSTRHPYQLNSTVFSTDDSSTQVFSYPVTAAPLSERTRMFIFPVSVQIPYCSCLDAMQCCLAHRGPYSQKSASSTCFCAWHRLFLDPLKENSGMKSDGQSQLNQSCRSLRLRTEQPTDKFSWKSPLNFRSKRRCLKCISCSIKTISNQLINFMELACLRSPQRTPHPFYETRRFITCSQEPPTVPFTNPKEFSPVLFL
jgi:hypothetical protein